MKNIFNKANAPYLAVGALATLTLLASGVLAAGPYIAILASVAAWNVGLLFIVGCAVFSVVVMALSYTAAAKNNRIADQEETISEQGAKLSQQKKTISEQGAELSQQKETISKQGAELSQQKETISKQGAELSQQEKTISELNTALTQHKETLPKLSKEIKNAANTNMDTGATKDVTGNQFFQRWANTDTIAYITAAATAIYSVINIMPASSIGSTNIAPYSFNNSLGLES